MTNEGDDFANQDFRRSVWHQTATTVAMVTTRAGERDNVMACEWAMMVSASPLQFVIAIGTRKVTHGFIEDAREFGLNFCSDRQAKLSHVSGSYSLRDIDKWELAEFATYPAKKIQAVMIEGCALNVECRLVESHSIGTHTLFLGEALWARADDAERPLIYHGGKYWYLGDQVPKE